MKSTVQMKKRPSIFCKQLTWDNSSIHFFMIRVGVIWSQGIVPKKQLVTEQFKNFLDQYQLVVLVNAEIKTIHGIYRVKLPLFNGNDAVFSGVCLDQITVQFPKYPLQGRVEKDIRNGYKQIGGDVKNLPKLPKYVGGNIDFMIGIKYLRYYPEKICQLPSGLSIYKSWFKNSDGSVGIIGEPHEGFARIESTYQSQTTNFLSNQYHMFKNGFQINPDLPLLYTKVEKDYMHDLMVESSEKGTCNDEKTDDFKQSLLVRKQKVFETVESEISFRFLEVRYLSDSVNAALQVMQRARSK